MNQRFMKDQWSLMKYPSIQGRPSNGSSVGQRSSGTLSPRGFTVDTTICEFAPCDVLSTMVGACRACFPQPTTGQRGGMLGKLCAKLLTIPGRTRLSKSTLQLVQYSSEGCPYPAVGEVPASPATVRRAAAASGRASPAPH